jgi:arylsulfatase A-like enzyme
VLCLFALFFSGLVTGFSNWVIELIRGFHVFRFSDLFSIMAYYAFAWGTAGVFFSIAYGIFSYVRSETGEGIFFRAFLLGLLPGCYFLFVSYANMHYLPSFFSAQSIAVNIAVTALFLVLCLFLWRRRSMQEETKDYRNATALLLVVFSLVLLLSLHAHFHGDRSRQTTEDTTAVPGEGNHNVVFILLDALCADHLGCYGYSKMTSPAIDSLASQGFLFERAIAQSSRTKESTASLFTSTLPSTHNVRSLGSGLPIDLPTFFEDFKHAGYRTAIFSTNPHVSASYGFDRGVDAFFGPSSRTIDKTVLHHFLKYFANESVLCKKLYGLISPWERVFSDDRTVLSSFDPPYVTDCAIEWIGGHSDAPFIIYIHYEGGHTPYIAPHEDVHSLYPDFEGELIPDHPLCHDMFLPFSRGVEVPAAERQALLVGYDAKIHYHDRHLGRLFHELREMELDERTVILVTSDHGEEFYEHGGWGHGHSLYDELTHVPLIISFPPVNRGEGSRIGSVVRHIDLLPTMLALCNISCNSVRNEMLEGVDLAPLLKGDARNGVDRMSWAISEISHGGHGAASIRTASHALIDAKKGLHRRVLLFDLSSDPLERNDVSESNTALRDDLLQRLDEVLNASAEKARKPSDAKVDDGTMERLKALGYMR